MPLGAFDCLTDPAAFVVDGANRICHLGDAGEGLRLAAIIAALACAGSIAWATRRAGSTPTAMAVAISLAVVALMPGLFILISVRADAPLHAPATASRIRERMQEFGEGAEGLACVDVARDECLACQPLAQLVFRSCYPPPSPAAGLLGGRAIFGADGFRDQPCKRDGLTVICGHAR